MAVHIELVKPACMCLLVICLCYYWVDGCRLPFETVLMCSLPREARLCFTLVGVRVMQSSTSDGGQRQRINVPLGWVTTQLYNQRLYDEPLNHHH